ncbi:MAG: hypothetical protein C4575_06505 [Desulforudis sp.]|jgi:polysaccharide pyruvyl transferase WcaK-like protein|nr:MAG: hypothetical protein C4575_06505 [Desulforudis sp.]
MALAALDHIPDDIPGFWDEIVRHFTGTGKASPRVVIHGGYGKRNMGDDALLHSIYTRVKRYLPDCRVTVICHGPERIRPWYPEIATCHFKSMRALAAIFASDLYIIGGGGIVNKINTYSGYMSLKILDMKGKFLFLAALAAKICGAVTVFYGIGATSFPDPVVKYLACFSLNRADYVSVRDPLSIENLRNAGVAKEMILVQDPALSLEPDDQGGAQMILARLGLEPKERRQRPLVGLNLRYVGDPLVSNVRSLEEAVLLVQKLVRELNCDVLFLPISQHPDKHLEDDLDFGRQIQKRLAGDITVLSHYSVIAEYPHPKVFMALMKEMEMMILSRLHSVILGTKLGIPIVTVSYDDKVAQFVQLVGQKNRMITLGEFSAARVIPLVLALKLKESENAV